MQRLKKVLLNLLKIGISLSGLIYIFHKIPVQKAFSHWSIEMLPWVFLSLLLSILSMFFQGKRWRALLLEKGKAISLKYYYSYIALGYFFNNLLPGGIGGDAVKTVLFGRRFGDTIQSVAAIIVSRIIGLVAVFILFFIALPFVLSHYTLPTHYTVFIVFLFLFTLVCLMSVFIIDKSPRLSLWIRRFSFLIKVKESFSIYKSHKINIINAFIDSIWIQILAILMNFCFFKAFQLHIDLLTITVFTTITVTLTMLPISINGIGIRENVQVSLYSVLLGIPADLVLAATLVSYIPILFQAIQGAIVFVQIPKTQRSR